MALEKERATYERKLPEFLPAHEGKFVLIKGDDVFGFWDTYDDVLKAGYEKFKLEPFFVKRVSGYEQAQFIARDFSACQA